MIELPSCWRFVAFQRWELCVVGRLGCVVNTEWSSQAGLLESTTAVSLLEDERTMFIEQFLLSDE